MKPQILRYLFLCILIAFSASCKRSKEGTLVDAIKTANAEIIQSYYDIEFDSNYKYQGQSFAEVANEGKNKIIIELVQNLLRKSESKKFIGTWDVPAAKARIIISRTKDLKLNLAIDSYQALNGEYDCYVNELFAFMRKPRHLSLNNKGVGSSYYQIPGFCDHHPSTNSVTVRLTSPSAGHFTLQNVAENGNVFNSDGAMSKIK